MHLFFSKRQQIPCSKEEAIPWSLSPTDLGYCWQPSELGASHTTARQLSAYPFPRPWRCTGDESSGKRGHAARWLDSSSKGQCRTQEPQMPSPCTSPMPTHPAGSRATANDMGNSSEKPGKGKRKMQCQSHTVIRVFLVTPQPGFQCLSKKERSKKGASSIPASQASPPAVLQLSFWAHCVFAKPVPSQQPRMIWARSDLSTETHAELGAQVFRMQLVISGAWAEVLWRCPISESAKHLLSGKEVDLQVPFRRTGVQSFSWEHWLKAYCKGQVGVTKERMPEHTETLPQHWQIKRIHKNSWQNDEEPLAQIFSPSQTIQVMSAPHPKALQPLQLS